MKHCFLLFTQILKVKALHWDKDVFSDWTDLGTFPASVVSQIGGLSNSLDRGKVIYGYHIGNPTILL